MNGAEHIKYVIVKDLNNLSAELSLYPDESLLWSKIPGTTNSGGNLALHMVGNLRHFIGHVLGNLGYVRNRDAEFSDTAVPVAEIQKDIEACVAEISAALTNLSESDLEQEYPLVLGKTKGSTFMILLILISHLSYHLGQLNYHRRTISFNK